MPSTWSDDPQMCLFDQYLAAAGLAPNYRRQTGQRVYRCILAGGGDSSLVASCDPRGYVNQHLPVAEELGKRYHETAIRWFQRFVQGLPPEVPPRGQRYPWQESPLLVRFAQYQTAKGLASSTIAAYCRAVYRSAHVPRTGGSDPRRLSATCKGLRRECVPLTRIIGAREGGLSGSAREKTYEAYRALDRFLRDEAGIPEPVKPVKVKVSKPAKVKTPKPVKVKEPKPARQKAAKQIRARAATFERILLTRFEAHLVLTGTPSEYAARICRSLHTIHREGARYDALEVCDPAAFVAERYPCGDLTQTRSRVATIRRFQEFTRATAQVAMAEGVLA